MWACVDEGWADMSELFIVDTNVSGDWLSWNVFESWDSETSVWISCKELKDSGVLLWDEEYSCDGVDCEIACDVAWTDDMVDATTCDGRDESMNDASDMINSVWSEDKEKCESTGVWENWVVDGKIMEDINNDGKCIDNEEGDDDGCK